jgi:hypothetical protein
MILFPANVVALFRSFGLLFLPITKNVILLRCVAVAFDAGCDLPLFYLLNVLEVKILPIPMCRVIACRPLDHSTHAVMRLD